MILANFTVNRWITVGRLEREGGGFFFLDGSSRHRAIFPSLCAAEILRDKSDKSIRHAELTYDPSPPAVPRLRTRSKASSVPIPGKRATFYHNTFILVPEFVLFSRQVNRPTRRYLSLSLSLSQRWLLHGQIFLNSVETLRWRSCEQISPAKGRWITIPREYPPLTPAS